MCLTIPKKVVEVLPHSAIVEDYLGDRQELKTLIELAVGDFVISQQNIILEKIPQDDALELLQLISDIKEGKIS
jgi:hydrogenase maturation factor